MQIYVDAAASGTETAARNGPSGTSVTRHVSLKREMKFWLLRACIGNMWTRSMQGRRNRELHTAAHSRWGR